MQRHFAHGRASGTHRIPGLSASADSDCPPPAARAGPGAQVKYFHKGMHGLRGPGEKYSVVILSTKAGRTHLPLPAGEAAGPPLHWQGSSCLARNSSPLWPGLFQWDLLAPAWDSRDPEETWSWEDSDMDNDHPEPGEQQYIKE